MAGETLSVSAGDTCEDVRVTQSYWICASELAGLGSAKLIVDWLPALLEGRFITDSQAIVGMRWRADWLAHVDVVVRTRLLREDGEGQIRQDVADAAGARLISVRSALGVAAEQWLVMLLIQNLGLPILTELLYPDLPKSAARHAMLNTFVFVLEQLNSHYKGFDAQSGHKLR